MHVANIAADGRELKRVVLNRKSSRFVDYP